MKRTLKPQGKQRTHADIVALCTAIRLSFLDAAIVYTHGGCYGFFKIMRTVYPDATAYMTENEEHVLTCLDGRYYDILGEYVNLKGDAPRKLVKLNHKQMEYWDTVSAGQRVEHIIKKYNRPD